MNHVYLSKSKYCKAKQCNKILWLDKFKPEEKVPTARESVLTNGTKVGELAKGLFGAYEDVEYHTDLGKMLEQTKTLLEGKPNIITEASFDYEHNFCSVDILKNDTDGMEIYEVKSSTAVHDIYVDDAAYQYYVLTNLGYPVKKVSIVHLNSDYVRQGELDLEQLFTIEDITEIAQGKQEEIRNKIDEINQYMDENEEQEPEKELGMQCFKPYECEYWQYCSRNLPENNIFQIRLMHMNKKFQLYEQGKCSMEEVQYEEINPKYLEQIDFTIHEKEDKIEVDAIRDFMKTLSYPIYFLDFETFQQAIPEYDGVSPYMQIPFQYSLHYIQTKGGVLEHKEFLAEAGIDPRRKLAERLVADIPKDVCVTAYNMSFEKSVIAKLAELYPDLSEHLLNIRGNIKDLMIPFKDRMYYTKAMEGSYSIKYVLPALFPNDPELDYHNLPVVHNGGEASDTFVSLAERSKEEQEVIRNGLLVYCKLDTYAMVKVWQKLNEVIGE